MKRCLFFALALLLLLPVASPALAQEDDEAQAESTPEDHVIVEKLVIGVLPVFNASPYTGYMFGRFQEAGSSSALLLYPSAASLREAVSDGDVNGIQADLITTLVLLEAGQDLRLVRHIGIASPAQFGLVSAADSGIMSAEDLRGARIGVSLNTIVQYLTDLMLASAGIGIDEVELVDVPDIRAREAMLTAGELDAATLPEPYLYHSQQAGARLLIDDSVVDYVPEALAFTADILANEGAEVRLFLAVYEQYLNWLNLSTTYEEAIEQLGGDEFLRNVDAIARRLDHPVMHHWNLIANTPIWPALETARVPTAEEFAFVQDWALAAGLVSAARAYEDVVDDRYLPEAMADGDASDGDDE